jgi:hypothetical protein
LHIRDEHLGDTTIRYSITLAPRDGAVERCSHAEHGGDEAGTAIHAEMYIRDEDRQRRAHVTSVVVGCWVHGPEPVGLRGCGVGSALMLICECIALGAGAELIALDDASGIPSFYKSLGYQQPHGDEVMEKTPDEITWTRMVRALRDKIADLTYAGECTKVWKKVEDKNNSSERKEYSTEVWKKVEDKSNSSERKEYSTRQDGTKRRREHSMRRDGTKKRREHSMRRDGTKKRKEHSMRRDGTEKRKKPE